MDTLFSVLSRNFYINKIHQNPKPNQPSSSHLPCSPNSSPRLFSSASSARASFRCTQRILWEVGPCCPLIPSSLAAEAESSLRILLPPVGWQDTRDHPTSPRQRISENVAYLSLPFPFVSSVFAPVTQGYLAALFQFRPVAISRVRHLLRIRFSASTLWPHLIVLTGQLGWRARGRFSRQGCRVRPLSVAETRRDFL